MSFQIAFYTKPNGSFFSSYFLCWNLFRSQNQYHLYDNAGECVLSILSIEMVVYLDSISQKRSGVICVWLHKIKKRVQILIANCIILRSKKTHLYIQCRIKLAMQLIRLTHWRKKRKIDCYLSRSLKTLHKYYHFRFSWFHFFQFFFIFLLGNVFYERRTRKTFIDVFTVWFYCLLFDPIILSIMLCFICRRRTQHFFPILFFPGNAVI